MTSSEAKCACGEPLVVGYDRNGMTGKTDTIYETCHCGKRTEYPQTRGRSTSASRTSANAGRARSTSPPRCRCGGTLTVVHERDPRNFNSVPSYYECGACNIRTEYRYSETRGRSNSRTRADASVARCEDCKAPLRIISDRTGPLYDECPCKSSTECS